MAPDSRYEYRVSSDDQASAPLPWWTWPAWSQSYRFRTAPREGDFTFAFLCDIGLAGRPDGKTSGTLRILDEVLAARPLFILGGGDYAYVERDGRFRTPNEAHNAWFIQMQPVLARMPFMAQYGNHEVGLSERFSQWAPRFAHPKGFDDGRNYSFDVGSAHFVGLFVSTSNPLGAEQLAWLDRDLAEARARGQRWIVIYHHYPFFALGVNHPAEREAGPMLAERLAPILEKHRVDLNINCHDQSYERTFPLTGLPGPPKPASLSPSEYEAGSGVIYAKVSPSGKGSFSTFTGPQQPFMAVRADTHHHYALITVRGEEWMEFQAYGIPPEPGPRVERDYFAIRANKVLTRSGCAGGDTLREHRAADVPFEAAAKAAAPGLEPCQSLADH